MNPKQSTEKTVYKDNRRWGEIGVAPLDLCLALVNTEGEVRNNPPDRLETLELFLDWAESRGLAGEAGIERFRQTGQSEVETFLARARTLREALYRILSQAIAGRPAVAEMEILEDVLGEALSHLALRWSENGFLWELPAPPGRLEELLWPIALSAADLLRSDRLDRVKECGSETCSWIFIDESRNRSRRWCEMSDCGNRAKARRFYRRQQSIEGNQSSSD